MDMDINGQDRTEERGGQKEAWTPLQFLWHKTSWLSDRFVLHKAQKESVLQER